MRVLHSAAFFHPSPGIIKQMTWEQESARELGLDWSVRMYSPNGPMTELSYSEFEKILSETPQRNVYQRATKWWKLRSEYHDWLLSLRGDFDVFLLRYSVHDPFQLRFVRKIKKPVYFVHHTLEEHELLGSGSIGGRVRSFFDTLIGRRTLSCASGIIGVTNEIIKEELSRISPKSLPSSVYPNGIKYSGGVAGDTRTDVHELLFVAGEFFRWHGLDVLLDSIRRNDARFVLHLVGNLAEKDLEIAERDPRIRIHGRLSNREIRNIARSCSVGLSSFALERKKMKEACPLKVREYLMLGLPVYSGHDDTFPMNFPYFRKGPADIDSILKFAADNSETGRETVSAAARPYIVKKSLVEKLASFLKKDGGYV